MTSSHRRRLAGSIALVTTIVVGLVVHRVLPGSPATDVAGDALYTVAVYAAIVTVVPRVSAVGAGCVAAGWSVAVELFQATGVPAALAAEVPVVALVLGTGFDPRDLVVYVAAAVTAGAVDAAVRRRTERRGATVSGR